MLIFFLTLNILENYEFFNTVAVVTGSFQDTTSFDTVKTISNELHSWME